MKDTKNRSPKTVVGVLSTYLLALAPIIVGLLVAWRYGDDIERTFRAVVGTFIDDPPVSLTVTRVRGGDVYVECFV